MRKTKLTNFNLWAVALLLMPLLCAGASAQDITKVFGSGQTPAVPAPAVPAPGKSPAMSWTGPLAVPLTKQVKVACEAKDDVNQAYCYGVLLSLYDSNFYVADALEASALCIPESTTAEQMRAAFLDMTKKRSDQLEGPISIFYYMAMDAEFPCAPGLPKPHNKK